VRTFLIPGIRRRPIQLRIDGLIVLALFVASGFWGIAFWKRAVRYGQPFYYQLYFEPAVMVGCGKGFVVARPQVPEMVTFLRQEVDHFSCDAIRPDTPFTADEVFQQGSWRYLMLSVGYTWRLFGVSWRALWPLFGALFATSIAAAYLIFRLGMGPLLAVLASVALAGTRIHLKYLPVLRDYAKAPLTLGLFFLLGLLVVRPATWRGVLAVAALYGAVLGIGYGFRADFASDFPPFFLTLFLFLPGGPLRHLRLKATAAAVCVVAFLVTGWPVISTLAKSKPGCQWHVVLLGFADEFDVKLGVGQVPYEISREYLDEYVYTTATSYAARVHPGIGHIEYCEPEYGTATRSYLLDVVKRFPADIIARAYSSVLRVVELPFSPVPGWDDEGDQQPDWGAGHGIGLSLVIAAIVLTTTVDLRLGLFLVFFLLYFGGLPAIQFHHRHFFHLAFIMLWAVGFLLQSALTDARPLLQQPARRITLVAGFRAAVVLAVCAAVLTLALWTTRAYQQRAIRTMLGEYLSAPREQIPSADVFSSAPGIRVSPHSDPETADFIAVDLNGSRCGERTTVTFRYEEPRRPYGRSFALTRESREPGLTHIFMPVYDKFQRIDFSDAPEGCVDGVYRVRNPGRFPMLLEVMLPPGWRQQPLYQRLGRAGADD